MGGKGGVGTLTCGGHIGGKVPWKTKGGRSKMKYVKKLCSTKTKPVKEGGSFSSSSQGRPAFRV